VSRLCETPKDDKESARLRECGECCHLNPQHTQRFLQRTFKMYQFSLLLLLPLVCHGSMIVGGTKDIAIDATDSNVLFALNAINNYYQKQGDNSVRTLVTIVKAQSQVVAGTLYHFTLRIQGAETELCKVKVWSRPWLNATEATQLSGDPECKAEIAATGSPVMGGISDIDAASPEVINALDFGVNHLNSMENNMFRRKATALGSVTKQVVSGMMYRFRGVTMANTECMKSDTTTLLSACRVNNSVTRNLACDFDIWWQSWNTPAYKITNWVCK